MNYQEQVRQVAAQIVASNPNISRKDAVAKADEIVRHTSKLGCKSSNSTYGPSINDYENNWGKSSDGSPHGQYSPYS